MKSNVNIEKLIPIGGAFELLDKATNISNRWNMYHKSIFDDMDYIEFDDRYIYRPDLVAYEIYGSQQLFPLILMANKVESVIRFNQINIGNKIMLPKNTGENLWN